MKILKILLIVPIVFLSSCASIYMNKSQDTAEEIILSMNRGEVDFPIEKSAVPFVFHGEIIITSSSVSRIWNGLVRAGFTITNPVVTSISPVVSDDFSLFRSSWEMESFFKNTIPPNTYKVTIEGIDGEVLMLINRDNRQDYFLLGLKADAK
ncbi:MAG: hypothetical protein JEY91_15710 [Spirochaetaceae bacterium]|nr:hypothetical protein [Spirochaetaceae bacterium]